MNYNDAIAAVQSGKYAWRTSWPDGTWLFLFGTVIYQATAGSPAGAPYQPTPEDQQATNFDTGDHPPKK